MGDIIPLRDYAVTRAGDPDSPWLRPSPPDWDPCEGCPVRTACREVRECQWGEPYGDDPEPPLNLRLIDPPDIIA